MGDQRTGSGEATPAAAGRLHGIDFWRGVILCTIFVNHVPGTLFERLTFKNFGLSDSSEAFVFIAGLSLALAYGRRVFAGERAAVVTSLARRAVKLYGTHVGLSLAGAAIFAAGAMATGNADLMQEQGRDLVVDDPVGALVGLFSLGHQFGYFNILPMYVVLMGLAPAMLFVGRSRPRLMLAGSFGLYALSRAAPLNVPTWPMSGSWFFDPFAWQVLVAIGIAIGFRLRRGGLAVGRLPLACAGLVVAAAAFCTTDGLGTCPGLDETVRALVDTDKTMLGLGRLVHALSLALCVYGLGVAKLVQSTFVYKPLLLIGQHGLPMFGLTAILSAIGQVVVESYGHPPLLDVAITGGGLAVMICAAQALSRRSVPLPLAVAAP
ncbi:OpgC family protein [Lichenibacterium dinghuense]|uniref:OpgC family protein n=1 Tax=Lichenibacterium dinghuense TaxID=2895977 RepID=UPI001F481EC5|nr:OpgC domain-containing protein [Lichenibacterium sp. 6Y81]